MDNPWLHIALDDYENHMAHDAVQQLQALDRIMESQLSSWDARTCVILGVAGGNGLEHVDPASMDAVYGVDINEDYLEACARRHGSLGDVLHLLHVDVAKDPHALPHADLLIADLFVEYVGVERFCETVKAVGPRWVSCVLQTEAPGGGIAYVSPYAHAFDDLDRIVQAADEPTLTAALEGIGFKRTLCKPHELGNGKVLTRLDFVRPQ